MLPLVAIMRDESKVSVDAQQRLSRPNIYIYTSSGIQLAEIPVSDTVEFVEVINCVITVPSGLEVG